MFLFKFSDLVIFESASLLPAKFVRLNLRHWISHGESATTNVILVCWRESRERNESEERKENHKTKRMENILRRRAAQSPLGATHTEGQDVVLHTPFAPRWRVVLPLYDEKTGDSLISPYVFLAAKKRHQAKMPPGPMAFLCCAYPFYEISPRRAPRYGFRCRPCRPIRGQHQQF